MLLKLNFEVENDDPCSYYASYPNKLEEVANL